MRTSFKLVSMFIVVVSMLWASHAASQPSSSVNKLKLFAVEIKVGDKWDKSKSPNEQAFFKEHSMNLKQLRKAGHIVMGARYSDIGLIIFSASSIEEVKVLMDKDPSMSAGTFKYAVHPINVFYPGMVGNKKSK